MSPLRLSCFAFVISVASAFARPSGPYMDNMILQRDMALPIRGKGTPGHAVKVIFAGQEKTTVADAKGQWHLSLDPLPASSEPRDLTVDDGEPLVFHDVLVGEVWLCSGQSNMGFTVKEAADAEKEIAEANDPELRLIGNKSSEGWKSASPQTVGEFSAVAYYFGRKLRRELKVPVGLLSRSVGGTMASQWTPRDVQFADPELLKTAQDRFSQRYATDIQQRRRKAAQNPSGPAAEIPDAQEYITGKIGGLFEGLIRGLAPYAIRGVIWYQGEGDARTPDYYAKLFPTLIRSWRSVWGQGDVPFLFVQLPSYNFTSASQWTRQRESQAAALTLPKTGMAVTIDVGEADNLHPLNKQEVGRRLALIALKDVYGFDIIASGPVFQSMSIEGDKVRVGFQKSASSLKLTGPEGFSLAGEDQKFFPAKANIEGVDLIVSSAEVKTPVAIRYAWDDAPVATLFNQAGLPAAPFRSDKWTPVSERPVYQSFVVEGGKIRLKFKPSPYALKLVGKANRDFLIAGVDRQFKPARIELDGPDLIVWSEEVPAPVAVRSSWSGGRENEGLFDEIGQQADAFRTDDWPPETF